MNKIPIVLCIDVEPELRQVRRNDPVPWLGYEWMYGFLSEQRKRLQDATESPVHFCWFLRMDPQVDLTWGSAEWAAVHYDRFTADLLSQGDDLGLHPHCYRWDQTDESWFVDDANQDWVNECIDIAHDAHRRVFNRPCESLRMGDGFMNSATMRKIEQGGARFELTPEPGSTPSRIEYLPERHTGVMPDCRGMPLEPYRPSFEDWTKPEPSRSDGITVIPMSVAFLPREWFPEPRLASLRRGVRRLLGLKQWERSTQTANLSCPHEWNAYIIDEVLTSRANPILNCALRTNEPKPEWIANLEATFDYLVRHPRRRELVFSTAREGIGTWGGRAAVSADPAGLGT